VFFLDAAAAKKYQYVYCEVVATNALGARLASGTFLPTVSQIAMPEVAGLSISEAKRVITDALGAVTFAKVTPADGSRQKRHPLRVRRDQALQGRVPAGQEGQDPPRRRLRHRPQRRAPARRRRRHADQGLLLLLRAGQGREQRRQAGRHQALGRRLPAADRQRRRPARPREPRARQAGCRRAGDPDQARVPFEETITRKRGIEAQDPYVESVRTKTLDAGRGFVLDIVVPQFDDLAIAPYFRALNGRDDVNGANLAKGPLNPGLGTDGKADQDAGRPEQRPLRARHRGVDRAAGRGRERVTGIDPDGNPLGARDGIYLRVMRKPTDRAGEVCGQIDLHSAGSVRIDASYPGANGVSEDGTLSIPVADRGRTEWQTVDGRQMLCKGECAQLGFANTAVRAHAANVVDDIVAKLKEIVAGIFGADQARTELAGGDGSVSLYQARRRGGVRGELPRPRRHAEAEHGDAAAHHQRRRLADHQRRRLADHQRRRLADHQRRRLDHQQRRGNRSSPTTAAASSPRAAAT